MQRRLMVVVCLVSGYPVVGSRWILRINTLVQHCFITAQNLYVCVLSLIVHVYLVTYSILGVAGCGILFVA